MDFPEGNIGLERKGTYTEREAGYRIRKTIKYRNLKGKVKRD